ncbi:cobalt-precorrin-5B (C(1))-methyltransferase [Photobacterium nomapromontoriensis]|uniref:cobalt-precorrin-5B (C(1))-methyltransferase n=1 Tax=Photobacterium nomapromontoriensis TaxID=2910237 RepID=UPI003D127160
MITQVKRSKHREELRTGYTTGACAAAASRAAVRALLTGQSVSMISIILPNQEEASFQLCRLEHHSEGVLAGVIKDGGDDPDCTHGIEIQCFASWSRSAGIHIDGGVGVAKVTLPGLELPVGMAAINPVPRKNIHEMAWDEWQQHATIAYASTKCDQRGLRLEIRVPEGETCAKQTISERLGLIGGISILGTRGTVKPYSTSAFSASVRQSVQVARANQLNHVVLTTGSRSERAAMSMMTSLGPMAFIQAGDFVGVGLRAAKRYGIERITVVAMIGKLGKLVAGHMMTHVSGHEIHFKQLADIAATLGADPLLCQRIASANTGRHVLEIVREQDDQQQCDAYLQALCQQAALHASAYIAEQVSVDVRLIDFDGRLLACYPNENESPSQESLVEQFTTEQLTDHKQGSQQ